MTRTVAFAILACCLVGSRPMRAVSSGDGLGLPIARVRPEPPLATHLTFPHPASRLGWGSFDLAAAPETDEIGVRVTLGAAVWTARWASCTHMRLRAGTRVEEVPLRHIEVGMGGGVYEAVTARLSIEHLRLLAEAPSLEAEVCEDRLPLAGPGGHAVRQFVRDFDDRALYDGPPPPPPPPELLPDGEWLPAAEPAEPAPA